MTDERMPAQRDHGRTVDRRSGMPPGIDADFHEILRRMCPHRYHVAHMRYGVGTAQCRRG